MNLRPPSSQKADARPISFVLVNKANSPDVISQKNTVNLVIRPEDLTRVDTSRMSVQQTLDGAWADNFGPGLPQITISGHTGWRRRPGDTEDDGEERFFKLKNNVFNQWHSQRATAIKAGKDPDGVQLVFADALDMFAVVVAPVSFTLRRSKSRPLLVQYQIAMTVLDQNIDQIEYLFPPGGDKKNEEKQLAGLDSMTASIEELTSYINSIQNYIDRTLVAPVQAFMNQTARLYGAVRGSIAAADGVAGSLISVAQMTAKAGINLFRTLAAVASLPSQAKVRMMQIAGAYSNIFCVLKNALNQQIYYPDYSPMFGSSNCSSTSGGRPLSSLSGQNPFYSAVPTSKPLPVSVSSTAQASLGTLAANDPVTAPLSISSLANTLAPISSGLVVA